MSDSLLASVSCGPAKWRTRRLAALFTILLSLTLVGCGSDQRATPKRSNPTFTLSEFSIKLDRPFLSAGTVTITADNVGAEEHEIIFVKASAVADLPTKADGSVDEDKIVKSDLVGEIGSVPARKSKTSTFDMPPGSYVAFCNVVEPMGPGSMTGRSKSVGNDGSAGMMNSGSKAAMGTGHVHFAMGMRELITVK